MVNSQLRLETPCATKHHQCTMTIRNMPSGKTLEGLRKTLDHLGRERGLYVRIADLIEGEQD